MKIHENSRAGVRGKAFTLIEIMIAMTIFMIIIYAIYATWSSILRGSQLGLAAAAEAQRTRITLNAFRESLSAAVMFTENPVFYSFLADTSDEYAALSFVSKLPPSFPGSGLFRGQDVRRVTFAVESSDGGQRQLVLLQTPVLEPPEEDVKPYTIVLTPEVSAFKVEFWDLNNEEWMPEWPWTNQLPRMVKMSVAFGDGKRSSVDAGDLKSRIVALPAIAVPRGYQVPAVARGGFGGAPGERSPGGGNEQGEESGNPAPPMRQRVRPFN